MSFIGVEHHIPLSDRYYHQSCYRSRYISAVDQYSTVLYVKHTNRDQHSVLVVFDREIGSGPGLVANKEPCLARNEARNQALATELF